MKYLKKIGCLLLALVVFCSSLQVTTDTANAATKISKTSIISVKEENGAKVTLKWKKVKGASGYYVYRKAGKKGSYKKLSTIKKASTIKYVDKTTKENTTYYYMVRAYKGAAKSADSATVKIKTSKAPSIGKLIVDKDIVFGSTSGVFTVAVKNGVRVKTKEIALYKKGEEKAAAYLNDSGKNGDAIANDGIFSVSTKLAGVNGVKDSYYAKYKSKSTNEVDVYFFDEFTEAEFDVFQNDEQRISEVANEYLTSDGNVRESDVENLISAVYEKALELKESGDAGFVERGETRVEVLFSSGIHYMYEAPIKDRDGVGSNVSMRILTYQPAKQQYIDAHRTEETLILDEKCTDGVAEGITEKNDFNNYKWMVDKDDAEVGLDVVNDFSDNQIILWHGHGSEPSDLNGKVYVVTGDRPTVFEEMKTEISRGICIKGKYLAFNSSYMAENVESMNNSMVYFATCHSMDDESWGRFFASKGVSVYVGNRNPIDTIYNCNIMKSTMERMMETNPDNGYKYTVSEGLEYAKSLWGETDGDGGYTVISRDSDADYRLSDVCAATVKLDKNQAKINQGKTCTIKATTNISDKNNLKWSVSDKKIVSLSNTTGEKVTVKGLASGSADVICKVGDKTVKCTVSVKETASVKVEKLPSGQHMIRIQEAKKKGDGYTITGNVSVAKLATISPSEFKKYKVGEYFNISDIGTMYCTKKEGSVFYFTEMKEISLQESMQDISCYTIKIDSKYGYDGKIWVCQYYDNRWNIRNEYTNKDMTLYVNKNVPFYFYEKMNYNQKTATTFGEFYAGNKRSVFEYDSWRGLATVKVFVDENGTIEQLTEIWPAG